MGLSYQWEGRSSAVHYSKALEEQGAGDLHLHEKRLAEDHRLLPEEWLSRQQGGQRNQEEGLARKKSRHLTDYTPSARRRMGAHLWVVAHSSWEAR